MNTTDQSGHRNVRPGLNMQPNPATSWVTASSRRPNHPSLRGYGGPTSRRQPPSAHLVCRESPGACSLGPANTPRGTVTQSQGRKEGPGCEGSAQGRGQGWAPGTRSDRSKAPCPQGGKGTRGGSRVVGWGQRQRWEVNEQALTPCSFSETQRGVGRGNSNLQGEAARE